MFSGKRDGIYFPGIKGGVATCMNNYKRSCHLDRSRAFANARAGGAERSDPLSILHGFLGSARPCITSAGCARNDRRRVLAVAQHWRGLSQILFILTLLFCFKIAAASDANSAEYIKPYIPQAEKVGEGRLTYMFWDVYDASLYAPEGDLEDGEPFALTLTYLRDITGRKIADRSAEEMRSLGMRDEMTLAAWHEQMRKIFPDVREGMTLTGLYLPSGETVFFKDSDEIGRIEDPQFGRYFFNIWLDENTSAPDLRRKLLGAR